MRTRVATVVRVTSLTFQVSTCCQNVNDLSLSETEVEK